jgi:hypothetical protein
MSKKKRQLWEVTSDLELQGIAGTIESSSDEDDEESDRSWNTGDDDTEVSPSHRPRPSVRRAASGTFAQGATVRVLEFSGGVRGELSKWVVVENESKFDTEVWSKKSGNRVFFLFAVVTARTDEGDILLSKLCRKVDNVGLHHCTYDAKSGRPFRITRLGSTREKLRRFAVMIPCTSFAIVINHHHH